MEQKDQKQQKPQQNWLKRKLEPSIKLPSRVEPPSCPEIALAAIVPASPPEQVAYFMNFLVKSLERNKDFVNEGLKNIEDFKCVLMVGAGPNRFQVHEEIYPSKTGILKFEVELRESEDFDKIAIAAMLRIPSQKVQKLLDFVNKRLHENDQLKVDIFKGKDLGINFAMLKPISRTKYRLAERLPNSALRIVATEKKVREQKLKAAVLRKNKETRAESVKKAREKYYKY